VRLVEARTAPEFAAAVARSGCALGLIDLAGRPQCGLEGLDRATRIAPGALILVLDPSARADIAWLARELGAARVLSGVTAPPEVVRLLARWLPIAQRRAEADGWALDHEPEPEPGDWFSWLIQDLLESTPNPCPGPTPRPLGISDPNPPRWKENLDVWQEEPDPHGAGHPDGLEGSQGP
jgi:hypothetical protein